MRRSCIDEGDRDEGLVTGYWLLITGDWLLVTGYWGLITGDWLLITDYEVEQWIIKK